MVISRFILEEQSCRDVRKQTPQLTESYKAGKFIMAPGARGIAPPHFHTVTKRAPVYYKAYRSGLDYYN